MLRGSGCAREMAPGELGPNFSTESMNQTNISPEMINSKRLIKDYKLANNMTVDTINITKEMIKAYLRSHLLHLQNLEDQTKRKALSLSLTLKDSYAAGLYVLQNRTETYLQLL